MVQSIQTTLESFISQLSSDSSSYVVQPDKDFTRSRKCSFQQMVSAILNMGGQTLSKELISLYFPISKAAFVQNRYNTHSISKSEQTHFLWTILFRVSLFNPRMISWSLSMTDSNV